MENRGSIVIFVKTPQAGLVKTRLAQAIGEPEAAELARAFFLDTLEAVRALDWARPIVAAEGDMAGLVERDVEVWDQGGGDLGERLERNLRRALEGSSFALAVGADSPGLPARLLLEARAALERSDAVLGPCHDGGFYLLGLTRCPEQLLAGLPWSSRQTCARTFERLEGVGLRTAFVEPWFDVDRPRDLVRLRRLLAGGELRAPATLAVLRRGS